MRGWATDGAHCNAGVVMCTAEAQVARYHGTEAAQAKYHRKIVNKFIGDR